jgi:acetyl esterase/lipase
MSNTVRPASHPPQVIPLWSSGLPGRAGEQESRLAPDIKIIRNVTQPTLTAYLPDPAAATGTAVIVCPGGAWHFLSIDMEGTDVATWLCSHGVAAFVLKYRLVPTGDDFLAQVQAFLSDAEHMDSQMQAIAPLVIADGQQAVRTVRSRAAEWAVAADRIGIMGFSAGGMVTANVARLYDPASRPDFAAPIYTGPYASAAVPADAPPLFVLCAADDAMAAPLSLRLFGDWRAAGRPAELHIYAAGGHGFGMRTLGQPSDTWIERFGEWLGGMGLLKRNG